MFHWRANHSYQRVTSSPLGAGLEDVGEEIVAGSCKHQSLALPRYPFSNDDTGGRLAQTG
jgi:hypothetical protein